MSNCLFCKIVAGEIPAQKVFEDERVLAFWDIAPKAKTHFLIIPKKHISSLSESADEDADLFGHIFLTAKTLAKKHKLSGYKLLMNVGKDGGQVVFHAHLHLLSGGKIHLGEC